MPSQTPLISSIRPAVSLFLVLTVVTGVAYPLAVTGVGQGLFAEQAQGSLLHREGGQLVGSRLIGQAFTDPGHFWSRPSATAPAPSPTTPPVCSTGPVTWKMPKHAKRPFTSPNS